MMSRLLSFIVVLTTTLSLSAQVNDEDVLLTVGDIPVTVSEFRYIYEKNNGDDADYSSESINQYLDLYTKFKLKVARAKDVRMDTIAALKQELDTYRRQLANSYLMDKQVMDRLLRTAFDRRQQDVQVAHLLVTPVRGRGSLADQEALASIQKIKEEINAGSTSWEEAIEMHSDDKGSAEQQGLMGYLTAMLPDGFVELEDAMYTLPIGQVSAPIKTKLGYHLIKVIDRRPARGVVEAAHIFIRKEKSGDQSAVEAKALEAYNELLLGKTWDNVVATYSDDRETNNKKGAIGNVTIGKYAAAFEDAVFALEQDGAYTMPVETTSGYHIIRRISKEDLSDYNRFKRANETKMERRSRYRTAREELIASIKDKHQYTVNEPALKHFTSTLGEDFYTFKWSPKEVEDVELFRFDEKIYKLADFVDYLEENVKSRQRYSKSKSASTAVQEMLDIYTDDEAILYEESNLEAAYPDFRNLMREYREGILLFEASKINVWDKASTDTVGLKSFYQNNKQRYVYPSKASVSNFVINTTDKKMVKKVTKMAKKKGTDAVLKKFNKKDEFFVKTYDAEVSRDSKAGKDLTWTIGAFSTPQVNEAEGKTIVSTVTAIEEGRLKTLAEARGYVIADYQDQLERVWVAQLRELYPVSLDKKILKSLTK